MADISPIRVYVGDDWLVKVALVDTNGAAINLTGSTVGANFWTIDQLPPVDLAAAGGGVSVVSANPALVLLTVPRSVTGDLGQQSVLARIFPCRAQIFYVVDTLNRQQTATLVPFQPVNPRNTDLPSALAVMTTVTAVLSPQGMAGPPGLSAYDIAVAGGFVGTEAQWLASLAAGGTTVLTFPITAASSFTASHSFPYRPRAWLVDASGAEVETDVLYASGQVTVIFPGPFTGTLYLG